MPESLNGKALGLIETRGLSALIAATDAAAKAASVTVRSVQRASGGLVLTTLIGDVASVQEAVANGAREAARVGELVSSHVIPRPDAAVWKLIGVGAPSRAKVAPAPAQAAEVPAKSDAGGDTAPDDGLADVPVRELRRRARTMDGVELSGREISRASKSELIDAIRRARR